MVLELHVWGPAFGLPSIDPECLAALSLFDHAVPRGQWRLVASNDAAVSPDRELFPSITIPDTCLTQLPLTPPLPIPRPLSIYAASPPRP